MPSAVRRALAAELKHLTEEFEKETRARNIDFDTLFEVHNRFHARLDEASASGRLAREIATINPQLHRYEYVYAPLVAPAFSHTLVEHRAITRAVRDGRANQIEAAVRANWWNSAERLVAAIDRAGGRGDMGMSAGSSH
jgi:DNA-binding GntR family transcriptional regulator